MRRRYHSRLPEIDWPYLLAPTLAARPDRRVPSTGMGPARHHRVSNGRSNVMERLFAELRRHADARPDHAALVDASHVITYRDLWPALQLAAAPMRGQRVGLLLGNGCAWALLALALLSRDAVCVPMPVFFSDAQLRHLIDVVGLDSIITAEPLRVAQLVGAADGGVLEVAGRSLTCHTLRPLHVPAQPPATPKLPYPSGTTGHPKGVCLTAAHIE